MTVNPQPLMAALGAACTDYGLAWGDGRRPTVAGTLPWVVLWADSGVHTPLALARPTDDYSLTVVANCYGQTPESARVAVFKVGQAADSLRRRTIAGRVVQGVAQLSAQPMVRDDDVDPPLFLHTAEWRFRTTPA